MSDLFDKQWVYWLDLTNPHDPPDGTYRVSIVFENESGHYPTGGGKSDPLKAPWYWDEETCKRANAERGFDEVATSRIVCSSMAVSRVQGEKVHRT